MSTVLAWMAQQPTLSPLTLPKEAPALPARRPRLVLVERLEGSVVPVDQARAELSSEVLEVLTRRGPQKLSALRTLISSALYVSTGVNGQASEISGVLKALRNAGTVKRNETMPYLWSLA